MTTPLLLERAPKLPAGFLPDPDSIVFDAARQVSAMKDGQTISPVFTWGEGDGGLATKSHEFFGDRDPDRFSLNSLLTWGDSGIGDDD